MATRIFSLAEADQALPLVRRITADIRVEYRAWKQAMADYELAIAGVQAGEGEPDHALALREEVERRAARVQVLVEELGELGCELKDFEQGLVDFYALLDDRLVFLCWRLGEDRIAHWHEVGAGFAGRQPVDATLFPEIVP
ncbi:MAG TPA: DUF2203 domain-containing protein [Gemmatimonadales bacterium]